MQKLSFEQLPTAVTILTSEIRELKKLLQNQPEPTPEPEQDDLITIKEACKLLNVSRTTLYRYERRGKVKIYGIGARRLLKRSELIESLTVKN